MNKKFLLPVLILCIGTVLAIGYYAIFSTTFNVSPAITITGDLEQDLEEVFAGDLVKGKEIIIVNNAPSERIITLSEETNCSIETSYSSELTLVQKVVDFGSDNWDLLPNGNETIVEYIIIGDTFTAEIVGEEIEGYVLIYYKDNSNRFVNPATGILIEDIEENLPYTTDGNFDEHDYCKTEEYDTCHGAKIWYIPEGAIDGEGNINWGMSGDFLFETNLIQYNSEGEITIYAESSITIIPLYKIGDYEIGNCTVTTTVA